MIGQTTRVAPKLETAVFPHSERLAGCEVKLAEVGTNQSVAPDVAMEACRLLNKSSSIEPLAGIAEDGPIERIAESDL